MMYPGAIGDLVAIFVMGCFIGYVLFTPRR